MPLRGNFPYTIHVIRKGEGYRKAGLSYGKHDFCMASSHLYYLVKYTSISRKT